MKKIPIVLSSLLLLFSTCVHAGVGNSNSVPELRQSTDSSKEIALSDYTMGEVHFTDKEEIRTIAQDYSLDDPEDIEEIIYVPLEETDEEADNGIKTRNAGVYEFYVKDISSFEERGEKIRSSTYVAPEGSMEVSDTISHVYRFTKESFLNVETKSAKDAINSALGFNVTKARTISNTQKMKVKTGYKKVCKAYVHYEVYEFQLWEDDLKYDDYIGKGCVKRPIGVIFTQKSYKI